MPEKTVLLNYSNLSSFVTRDNELTVLHINIRSFLKNSHELKLLLTNLHDNNIVIDIIAVCETNLNETSETLALIDGYTRLTRNRTQSKGGGVAIFCNETVDLIKTVPTPFTEGIFESISVIIKHKGIKYVVSEFYRPPNTDFQLFLSGYKNFLKMIKDTKLSLIICTDQNFDFLKLTAMPASEMYEISTTEGLNPLITVLTRVTYDTCTLIDNIYVNFSRNLEFKTAVIEDDISDHFPCLLSVSANTVLNNCNDDDAYEYVTKRKINDDAISKVNHDLLHHDWNPIYCLTVNEAYDYLILVITKYLNMYCPYKTIRVQHRKEFNEPWLTVELQKQSRKCKKLYSKTVGKSRTSKEYEHYISYRNSLNVLKKHMRKVFYDKLFMKIGKNSKTLWSV